MDSAGANTIIQALDSTGAKIKNYTNLIKSKDFKEQKTHKAKIAWFEEQRTIANDGLERLKTEIKTQLETLKNFSEKEGKMNGLKQAVLDSKSLEEYQQNLQELADYKVQGIDLEELAKNIKSYNEYKLLIEAADKNIKAEKEAENELNKKCRELAQKVINAYNDNDTVPVGRKRVKLSDSGFDIVDGDEVKVGDMDSKRKGVVNLSGSKVIRNECLGNIREYCRKLVNRIGSLDLETYGITLNGEQLINAAIKKFGDTSNRLSEISIKYKSYNDINSNKEVIEFIEKGNFSEAYDTLFGNSAEAIKKKAIGEIKPNIGTDQISEEIKKLKEEINKTTEEIKSKVNSKIYSKEVQTLIKELNTNINWTSSSTIQNYNGVYDTNISGKLNDLCGKYKILDELKIK